MMSKAKKKVAKKKVKGISERQIKDALAQASADADQKYAYAKTILDANSPEISEIVERMANTLGRMAGEPKLRIDGQYVNIDSGILHAINHKLHVWMAVRLLVAGAVWDVRISNFKLPKKSCARCGKKVKS